MKKIVEWAIAIWEFLKSGTVYLVDKLVNAGFWRLTVALGPIGTGVWMFFRGADILTGRMFNVFDVAKISTFKTVDISMLDYLFFANSWLPLEEFFRSLLVLIVFIFSWLVFKMIKWVLK